MLFISIASMFTLLLLLLFYTSEGSLNNVIVRNFVHRYFQIQPNPRKVYKLIIKKSKEPILLKKKKKERIKIHSYFRKYTKRREKE